MSFLNPRPGSDPDVEEPPVSGRRCAESVERRLARLLPGDAERRQPCGCGPHDPYTAHAEEWRACGYVISHLYLG